MSSTSEIVCDVDAAFAFVRQYAPVQRVSGAQGLLLVRDGRINAGVLYESHSGPNLWMHVALAPGKRFTMPFIRTCFRYPFVQLRCTRVSAYVEGCNAVSRKFVEHLGFREEAVLRGAASDGGDVILYAMWREDCRYVDPE